MVGGGSGRWEGRGEGGWVGEVSVYQKRLVSVVCDGLRHSWTSMPPGTVVSTEVTAGIVGLVRSVRVVGVLEGLMEALDISEAGPDGVPHCSVDPSDALSTQEPSCRSRFLRNFARAFWNQTCRGTTKKRQKANKKQTVTKGVQLVRSFSLCVRNFTTTVRCFQISRSMWKKILQAPHNEPTRTYRENKINLSNIHCFRRITVYNVSSYNFGHFFNKNNTCACACTFTHTHV